MALSLSIHELVVMFHKAELSPLIFMHLDISLYHYETRIVILFFSLFLYMILGSIMKGQMLFRSPTVSSFGSFELQLYTFKF